MMGETDKFMPAGDYALAEYLLMTFPSGEEYKILCKDEDKELAYNEFLKFFDGSVMVAYDFKDVKSILEGGCSFYTKELSLGEFSESAASWINEIVESSELSKKEHKELFVFVDGNPSMKDFTAFADALLNCCENVKATYNGMDYDSADCVRVNLWIK